MPLSEHEQRILAEIERRLLEEDPKFAHQVGSSFRAHLGRRLKLAVVGFVLGLVVVVSSTFFENNLGTSILSLLPDCRWENLPRWQQPRHSALKMV